MGYKFKRLFFSLFFPLYVVMALCRKTLIKGKGENLLRFRVRELQGLGERKLVVLQLNEFISGERETGN